MKTLYVCAALLVATPASAGSTSYYGRSGAYAGSSITRGNYSTFTDRGGRYIGSSIRSGRTTIVYDRSGNRAGSSTRTGRR